MQSERIWMKEKTKRRLKRAGVCVAVLAAAGACIMAWLGSRPAAPEDYQKTVETGGATEARFLADGPYEASEHEQGALQEFGKYIVCYPAELAASDARFPVIVLCNGSGTPLSKYLALARHYASWGFIVIGTEEEYAWNGFAAEMSIRYLERVDADETAGDGDNPFYGKVDFTRVGIAGHSQGAVGVFNALTATEHRDIYKTAVAISPTNVQLAKDLMWDYDPSGVSVPILLMSGAGGGDDWVVTGDGLREIFDQIASPKAMMRRADTGHGEMLYSADGYVLAWFMWQLQGDEEAAEAFTGESPEALANSHYQDQEFDLL